MSGNIDVLTAAALAVLVLMILTWIISILLRDAGIVDIVWGAGFVLVAWVSYITGDGNSTRSNLLMAMVAAWGARLTIYLWVRNHGKDEDYRYRAMRKRSGDAFAIRSFFTVFLLQGVLMWTVSLPVQLAMVPASPDVGLLGVVGVAIWGVGFFFESVGDSQLARFKADPDNEGLLFESGLWKYTRHPNYFGDFCVWWGLFLVTAETTDARYAIIGPIVMSIFLIRISGVRLLERSLAKRKPGYEEYVARTSAFIPRPPRKIS